jgi:uncharacterized damage-inducible protein DinB
MDMLKNQYELLLGSREVMFDFIEKELPNQLIEPIAVFNGSTIRYLLIHTANTYKHWLGNFGMSKELSFTDEESVMDIAGIRKVYAEVDSLVYAFLERFGGSIDEPVTNLLRGNEWSLTPLQLFTHVLTHEFHHKGQIMTMCRLLGHTPPDTDIIRT